MKATSIFVTVLLGAVILGPYALLIADEKLTLYDRNKRYMQSQGQYNRGYGSSNQDRGSQRNYYNSRDYYYDDYYYNDHAPSGGAVGRPPSPFR